MNKPLRLVLSSVETSMQELVHRILPVCSHYSTVCRFMEGTLHLTKYRLNHAKFRRYFAKGVKKFARNFDEISRRTKDEILRSSFSLLLISTVASALFS